ncbi:DUF6476 family protein [Roseococcus sp. YIM B11640]|uniref:DUF6476 family protein n=1 Tax=Roseococcus sp. YIM B11640 TaxID=3133973 RepID=UPI003C7A7549
MGVLIVAGTVTLVVLLVQRAGSGRGAGVSLSPMNLNLPTGSRIEGIAGAEGNFLIHVQRPDGERLLLLDGKTGRLIGEILPGGSVPVQ